MVWRGMFQWHGDKRLKKCLVFEVMGTIFVVVSLVLPLCYIIRERDGLQDE